MKRQIKYKKIGFFIMLITLLMPIIVRADTISIDCPSSVKVGEEVSCKLTGTTKTKVTSVQAKLSYGDKITFVSFANSGQWLGDASNNILGLFGDEVDKTFDIGVLKVKSSGTGNNSINLSSVVYGYDTDEDSIKTKVDSVSVNLNVNTSQTKSSTGSKTTSQTGSTTTTTDKQADTKKDSNNYISTLTIEGYELDFKKETTEYDIYANDEMLIINVKLESEKASYTIEGNSNLVNGSIININVVAEDDSTRVYKLKIHQDKQKNVDEENLTNKSGIDIKYIFIALIFVLVLVNIVRMINSSKKK